MKHIKLSRIIVVGVCLAGLTQPLLSQNGSQNDNKGQESGIPGFLDPKTGAFKPIPPSAGDNQYAIENTSPTTGKIVVNFKITIDSSIPTSDTISCGAEATVFETATQHVFDETAAVAATRSGSSATCTVTIPYSWILTTPTQDTVTINFTLSAPAAANQPNLPNRFSNQTVAIIKVPANGVTTTENVSPVF